jgi:phospholipase D1/2
VKWFIDGKDYFYALSEALEHAKTSITIWGWWVTPELFLRRPPVENKQWRLDRMYVYLADSDDSLARAAERNVKVYGIVYQEVSSFLPLDSEHTVQVMNKINPNIRFMRHPEHDILKTDLLGALQTLYWSHHDKAVVIDDQMVFWGGLDACFGRWDYNAHPLADLHSDIRHEDWVGQDYNNARIMDFTDVGNWRANMLNRTEYVS